VREPNPPVAGAGVPNKEGFAAMLVAGAPNPKPPVAGVDAGAPNAGAGAGAPKADGEGVPPKVCTVLFPQVTPDIVLWLKFNSTLCDSNGRSVVVDVWFRGGNSAKLLSSD